MMVVQKPQPLEECETEIERGTPLFLLEIHRDHQSTTNIREMRFLEEGFQSVMTTEIQGYRLH
jgi:hypothetical protein